jgi:flagellar motor component MotA
MTRFILGIVFTIAALMIGAFMFGGSLVTWLHPVVGAFFLVVVSPWFAAMAVWSRKDVAQAFRDAFRPVGGSAPVPASSAVWKTFEYLFYVASVIGLFTGLVITFNHLSYDPANLGGKLGASLIAPFYGILLAMVARLLRIKVEAR